MANIIQFERIRLERDLEAERPSIAQIILATRPFRASPGEVRGVIALVHPRAESDDILEAERDADSIMQDMKGKMMAAFREAKRLAPAMINWAKMLCHAEDWANGFWVGAATSSLIAISGAALMLFLHAI